MITAFSPPTLPEIIKDRATIRHGGQPTTRSLLQGFRKSEGRLKEVVADLQKMFVTLGFNPTWQVQSVPITAEIGTLPHEKARQALEHRFADSVDYIARNVQRDLASSSMVGRITWLGPRECRFSFFDTERSRTLTRTTTRTLKHTHDLIHARKVRLPARSVRKPKACRALIRAMPPWVRKHSYIVAGTQINANIEQVGETDRPSELVVLGRWIGRKLQEGRRKAARAGAQVVDAAARLGKSSTAILRDPALVIGDYVLFGWEE